jgi:hypothetical protein
MWSARSGLWADLRALGFAVLACAGSCGAPAFDGRVYRGDGMAFRVGPVPEGWRQIDVDQSLLSFRDDTTHVTIAVSGRCGQDSDDVPLRSLTHHLFLYFTDRRVLSEKLVRLDGREALRTELVADLDGVAKHFVVYVLKKDGCVYDFMRIGDSLDPEQSRAAFERFVQGFATLSQS